MIHSQTFGTTKKGASVKKYILTNSNGYEVHILSYGLIIQKLLYPTKGNAKQDIVLGFDGLHDYESDKSYFGCIVGRNANRLAKGTIIINNKEIQVSQNEDEKQLHGGFEGFNRKNWDCTIEGNTLIGTYVSPHLEEGFPGEITTTVIFELTDANELHIETIATTDRDTVVNLTRHEYFNLKDGGTTDTLSHQIQINADSYTPTDNSNLVTGEIIPVKNTPFDLRQPVIIGERLKACSKELPMGFDHNFVTNFKEELTSLAITADPESGRSIEILSTQPGIQFYNAAFLDGMLGKNKTPYHAYHGLCLESQHFPDNTKHSNFSSSIITKETPYTQNLIYKFTS